MNIDFKVSKLANQYFFISNLTEWHFSCRRRYNKEWLKKTGPLKKEDKKFLNKTKQTIKTRLHYGYLFFTHRDDLAWKKINSVLPEKDYYTLRATFDLFEKRFRKIWFEKKLKKWKENLKKSLKQKAYKNLINSLAGLFPLEKEGLPKITVHLLSNPVKDGSPAGGANIGSGNVTLEVPVFNIGDSWYLEAAWAVTAHEIAHVLLDKSNIPRIIKQQIKKHKLILNIKPQRKTEEIIKEIIINVFVPSGYLAQKYLKNYSPFIRTTYLAELGKSFNEIQKLDRKGKIDFNSFSTYSIWRLYPLAVSYLENNKKIDGSFVEHVVKVIGTPKG